MALLMVIFEETSYQDVAWSLGSILFVIIYMTYHLGSIFLSFMGMLQILYSFTLTQLIYSGILNISYFSVLH